MDTQDALDLEASSLEKAKPSKDYSKRRARRKKGRPTDQQPVTRNTSHAAHEKKGIAEVPSPENFTSFAGRIEDAERNNHGSLPQVPNHKPGRECLSIDQPLHTSLPLRNSSSKVNNRPGQVPSVPKSNLSVPAHHASSSLGFDTHHRHTKAQTSIRPKPNKIARRSDSPSASFQPSAAPSSVHGPHRTEDHNTHESSPPKFLVKDPHKHLPPPTPTPSYVDLAHATPTLLHSPQNLLLVLDLNGTLLHRTSREIGRSKDYTPRPSLDQFLQYAFEHHSLLIWSSAQPSNVAGMCTRLFSPAQRELLVGQWARDTLGLTKAQYKDRVQVYKRLDRIWDDESLQQKHPNFDTGGWWGQHNTVLIDDSLLKASAQPYNLIEVPVFVAGGETDGDGKNVLKQVAGYLDQARRWDNVSAFMREQRFQIDAGWEWVWTDSSGRQKRKKRKEKKKKQKIADAKEKDKEKDGEDDAVGKERAENIDDNEADDDDDDGGGGGVRI